MLQEFGNLKAVATFGRRSTESVVFYLNYRVTFLILLFCCILLATKQFSDDKIECSSGHPKEINYYLLKSYCWAASTFSIRPAYLREVGGQVPHPGVIGTEKESEYEYRNFYQYIHIVIFIQAVMFYLPHALWKCIEPNFISAIPKVITKSVFESKEESDQVSLNVSSFIEDRWGSHQPLALKYFMCESLAFVNVLIQTYLLDVFLHGKFISLGLLFGAYYNSEILSDPVQLFPLVTVCKFRRYGPSGHIDVIDALCVLPVNALNGKVFLCLWIWFTILAILSFANLIYLVVCIVNPKCRVLIFKISSYFPNGGRRDSETYIKLASVGDFGDWFVLSSLKHKIDDFCFYRITDNVLSKVNSLDIESKEA